MRIIQFMQDNQRHVGLVQGEQIAPLKDVSSVYELAQQAIQEQRSLEELVPSLANQTPVSYQEIIAEGRLLVPFDHPDQARMLVTGTGLTHLGSADTRATMHAEASAKPDAEMTDTMKMFKLGLEDGKPANGAVGVQPEWFYKGDGTIIANPGAALTSPAFALDGGEEPEIVGLYINDADGQPWRVGYALGNEFSDHVTEQQNYLYLAHSKLRPCSFGPELLLGELPADVQGHSRIIRDGKTAWEKPFVSGEQNMSHSITNLEFHHFKYPLFRRAGDAHAHFFGTATLSFGDKFETQPGDVFEISAEVFGQPLRNSLSVEEKQPTVAIKSL